MAQFLRPDNDDSIGSWTDAGSGTTNIYLDIAETSFDDADYVRSEDDPSSSIYIAGLGSGTDPASSTDHVVRYRYQKGQSGGGSPGRITVTIELRQGTTVIASQSHADISTTVTAGTFTLSEAEADSITDYTDLNVRMTADKTSGARTSWGIVTWFEFEIPSLSTGIGIQVNIGDVWKEGTAMKINIGGVWKDVVAIKQNIGDVWKDVF